MLASVVASLLLPIGATGVWAHHHLARPHRFAATVADLPAHPLVRRAVRRRSHRSVAPLVDRVLATRSLTRGWHRSAARLHPRLRRRHPALLLATAGFATCASRHGRRRIVGWVIATALLAVALGSAF